MVTYMRTLLLGLLTQAFSIAGFLLYGDSQYGRGK
jgi:hypothetical protein